MEGLRVSKLEEGQQWGKNTSSKDKVQWGRRPPFIKGEKSNRYVLSPHTSGTTAQMRGTISRAVVHIVQCNGARPRASSDAGAVLPLAPVVLPLRLQHRVSVSKPADLG